MTFKKTDISSVFCFAKRRRKCFNLTYEAPIGILDFNEFILNSNLEGEDEFDQVTLNASDID